jgi:uncharacterized protein (TIGR01777 family)
MKGKVIIAGGNGYIGRHLAPHLRAAEYEVLILSREKGSDLVWDGRHLDNLWVRGLEDAYAVVNLSGVSISKPWNERNRNAIMESRVESTEVLGKAIGALNSPPKVWVNGSAVGFYGDRGSEMLIEASGPGPKGHFLSDVCVAWENELMRAETKEVRKVALRTGVVLGPGSLAFQPLLTSVKCYLGGPIGSGSQFVSWIHIHDLVSLILWTIESDIQGPINGTAPEPVTNADMMMMMRAILRRPWAPPVPPFLLRIISFLGGPEASLALESTRALPEVALTGGFRFAFPHLREALVDLTSAPQPQVTAVHG